MTAAPTDTLDAWIILCKPTIRDQLTLELGARLSATVQLLAACGPHSLPDIICLCGNDLDGKEATAVAAAATAGAVGGAGREAFSGSASAATLSYHFLRSAAEARGIDLSGVTCLIEPHAEAREGVLSTTIALRARAREAMAARASAAASATADAAANAAARRPPPRANVKVISTDHQVHLICDIDALTPRHSLLAPLRDINAVVSFERAPDPFVGGRSQDARRRARYIRLAEQLSAVRANLRGVEAKTDFLHRENSRRIADVRAALSEALWELMPRNGGQRALRSPFDQQEASGRRGDFGPGGGGAGLPGGDRWDTCELACLEASVSCLGRTQEALAPLIGDPLRGEVSADALRHAMAQLAAAVAWLKQADPDRPVTPDEIRALLSGEPISSPPPPTPRGGGEGSGLWAGASGFGPRGGGD
jgi:hypothetical protein